MGYRTHVDKKTGQKRVIDFPNKAVAVGMEQTVQRLKQMEQDLKKQADELRSKANKVKREAVQVIENDYVNAVAQRLGYNIGDCFIINGYSRAISRFSGSVSESWDTCDDPSHNPSGTNYGGSSRNCYYLSASVHLQGAGSNQIACESVWADDMSVYSSSDAEGNYLNDKPRCELPAGSHFPLRESVVNALRSVGLKVAEDNGEDYDVTFHYCKGIGSVGRNNNKHVPVDNIVITLDRNGCQNLRQIANHRNRYTKLVDKLVRRGWIESHEFQQVPGNDGFIKECYFILQFKMLPKVETEEVAN